MSKNTEVNLSFLLFIGILIGFCTPVLARDYFDPGLLSLMEEDGAVDLSQFEVAGKNPEGTYVVNLYINQQRGEEYSILFKKDASGKLKPQLSLNFMYEIGVNKIALPAVDQFAQDTLLDNLDDIIPGSTYKFDFKQLRLDISVPQIYMQKDINQNIDPKLYDHGVTAFLLNYNVNGSRNIDNSTTEKNIQTNHFINMQSGLNLGAWRLRGNFTYSNSSNGFSNSSQTSSNFSNIYLQRSIIPWKAELTLGEQTTSSDIFDSVAFSGIGVASSDEMQPANLRGFAPLISGVANTNARVTVSQNGYVVYQTFVPPGPFIFTDLQNASQGGDLLVTITEADNSVRKQLVAYSSLPMMLRPGRVNFELATGRYKSGLSSNNADKYFSLATLTYGLPYDLTLYGGSLLAKDYVSMVAGTGLSLGGLGALSADITTSSTKLANEDTWRQGAAYRMRYAKSLLATGTSIDLAAYRFFTKNYYSFNDVNNQTEKTAIEENIPWSSERRKSTFSLQLSQDLGKIGSLYISGNRDEFQQIKKINNTLSIGYNTNIYGINYGLSYSISRVKSDDDWPENRQLSFNMQVPLSLFTSSSISKNSVSYRINNQSRGEVQQQAGLSGSAMDNRLSYNLTKGWGQQNSNSTAMNLGYQGNNSNMDLGYSAGSNYSTVNWGMSGGVIAHPKGITLSPSLGSSVAVVSTPNAEGVGVMNGGVYTNAQGLAVVPYVTNYQKNIISLDLTTLPDDVDLTQSTLAIYPTKGAVVMAEFATRIGYQVLFTIQKEGNAVPFGAIVNIKQDNTADDQSAIVGTHGQVYLTGLADQGQLQINWGQESSNQCVADYDLSEAKNSLNSTKLMTITIDCINTEVKNVNK